MLAALAHHFAAAAPVGGTERAVSYNLLAAESAIAALAYGEARGATRNRARARRPRPARARGRDAPAGRRLPSRRARRRGARRLLPHRRARTLPRRRVVARPRGDRLRGGVLAPRDPRRGLDRAARGGASPLCRATTRSFVRGRSAASRGRSTSAASRPARPSSRDEAIAMSRRRGDRRTLGTLLAMAYWARGSSMNEEVNRMLVEARAIGHELDDDLVSGEAVAWLVPSFVVLCDHHAARDALTELFAIAQRVSQPFHFHVAEHYASALALERRPTRGGGGCRRAVAGVGESPHRPRRLGDVRHPDVRDPPRAGPAARARARRAAPRRPVPRRRLAAGSRGGPRRARHGERRAARARRDPRGRCRCAPPVALARLARLPRRCLRDAAARALRGGDLPGARASTRART